MQGESKGLTILIYWNCAKCKLPTTPQKNCLFPLAQLSLSLNKEKRKRTQKSLFYLFSGGYGAKESFCRPYDRKNWAYNRSVKAYYRRSVKAFNRFLALFKRCWKRFSTKIKLFVSRLRRVNKQICALGTHLAQVRRRSAKSNNKQVFCLCSHLALTFTSCKLGCARQSPIKNKFFLPFRSPCTNFHFVQVRRRLGYVNKNKFFLPFRSPCTNFCFAQVRLRSAKSNKKQVFFGLCSRLH